MKRKEEGNKRQNRKRQKKREKKRKQRKRKILKSQNQVKDSDFMINEDFLILYKV